jgi:ribosomal-protein-alanine N-acetyltransferase
VIRTARRADLPALRAIQAEALAEPWQELLTVAVDGPPILLVDADPDPVGYALCVASDGSGRQAETDEAPADGSGDATAYLAELAVAAGYRGERRGSALLASLEDRLRASGYERLRLTVRAVDRRAISFYLDRAFERRDRLPDHYETGDGLLLGKPLR